MILFFVASVFSFASEFSITSPTMKIDKKHMHMMGPDTKQTFKLHEDEEFVWATGAKLEVVDQQEKKKMSDGHTCHTQFRVENYGPKNKVLKLFTLSANQMEFNLPKGFGVPISSSDFSFYSQLVSGKKPNKEYGVKFKGQFKYEKSSELKKPLKPLFVVRGIRSYVLLKGEHCYFGVKKPNMKVHGPDCLKAKAVMPHHNHYVDEFGKAFSGMWWVQPGENVVNNTLVTHSMNLPYDSTLHAISVHAHPYTKSVELRDLTAGKTVFLSTMKEEKSVDYTGHPKGMTNYFSSGEGIKMFKNHHYSLIVNVYNPTDKPIDAMADMALYLLDKEFEKKSRLSKNLK